MIFRVFVARREILRAGEGAERDSHHRLALLPRGDGAARVREPVATPAHVDRPRRRRRRGRCCSRASARCADDAPVVVTPTARCCAARHRASSPSTSGSRTARCPDTSATSWWSVPGRPAWRRRCTARRKASTRSRSTPSRVGGQAGASSRIENYVGFPNGISGEDLDRARRDPGAAARRPPQRAVRGRRPARGDTAST